MKIIEIESRRTEDVKVSFLPLSLNGLVKFEAIAGELVSEFTNDYIVCNRTSKSAYYDTPFVDTDIPRDDLDILHEKGIFPQRASASGKSVERLDAMFDAWADSDMPSDFDCSKSRALNNMFLDEEFTQTCVSYIISKLTPCFSAGVTSKVTKAIDLYKKGKSISDIQKRITLSDDELLTLEIEISRFEKEKAEK